MERETVCLRQNYPKLGQMLKKLKYHLSSEVSQLTVSILGQIR
jgi:hypothetical protein